MTTLDLAAANPAPEASAPGVAVFTAANGAASAHMPMSAIFGIVDLLAEVCVARLAAANLDCAPRNTFADGAK